MRKPPGYPIRSGFAPASALAAALWLAACAPSVPIGSGNGARPAGAAAADQSIRFQFIYVIHGDGSYGFFDPGGGRRLADSEALAGADSVGRGAADAEVFVFHQKPVRILGWLRAGDGTVRHYRNGSLLRTETYRRSGSTEGLGAESAWYRMHAAGIGREPIASRALEARVFLYFGHGIPEHALPTFAGGLGRFAAADDPGEKPFSLVILSACNGGIPAAIRALAPHANRILASPGELHLSYMDAGALIRFTREDAAHAGGSPALADGSLAERWGRAIATESFEGLRQRASTAITVALYDADKAAEYLDARKRAWHQPSPPEAAREKAPPIYRDCADIPGFGPGGAESGASVFYRPARFGPEKGRASHSGWECREPTPPRLGSLGGSG